MKVFFAHHNVIDMLGKNDVTSRFLAKFNGTYYEHQMFNFGDFLY